MKVNGNNKITLAGEISENFVFSHEIFGERFYTSKLKIERTSGVSDFVPIMVSNRMVDVSAEWKGNFVQIEGQLRTCIKKGALLLSAFTQKIEQLENVYYNNNIVELDGYICKETLYRTTKLGREITDFMVAVNRHYGKSDYIPCICWGRNARFADNLEVGTHVKLEGRIQSREYINHISDEETETRTAYELSVSKLELVEDEN